MTDLPPFAIAVCKVRTLCKDSLLISDIKSVLTLLVTFHSTPSALRKVMFLRLNIWEEILKPMRNSQPDRHRFMSYANLSWFLKAMGDKLQNFHTFIFVGVISARGIYWLSIGSPARYYHWSRNVVSLAPSSASKLPNKWQTSDIHEYSVHWQVWRCRCSFDLHFKRSVCEPHPSGCFKATLKSSDPKISNLKHVGEARISTTRDSDKLKATN